MVGSHMPDRTSAEPISAEYITGEAAKSFSVGYAEFSGST
jgi:hypothetical protein